MKYGDLVRARRGPDTAAWTALGVIVGTFDHPTATCASVWFKVALKDTVLVFRDNYLEVISEAR